MNREAGGTITRDDITRLLEMFPTIKVREVSALTNLNVSEVFNQIVSEIENDSVIQKPQEEYYKV